jgi:anti-sigma regulatory factor (Ser/Thr protein kinase)
VCSLVELSADIELPSGPRAAAAGRSAVRAVLRDWGYRDEEWIHTAQVVATELVANAVRHAGGCLGLAVSARGGVVTISALDGAAAAPLRREPSAAGGRGIVLVEALTEAWGVEPLERGKRVWARLRPSPGSPG